MKMSKNGFLIFIASVLVFGCIGVVGATALNAKDILYRDTNVEAAIDDLYIKANKTATQVATLTTQGASYTMQNDGYVTGTAQSSSTAGAIIYFNNSTPVYMLSDSWSSTSYNVSLYVSKGIVVSTRNDGGTYNLTVYEWK